MKLIELMENLQKRMIDKTNLLVMVGVNDFSELMEYALDAKTNDDWTVSAKQDGFIISYKDMQIVRLETADKRTFMVVQMMELKELEGGVIVAVGGSDESENTRTTH